MSHEFDAAIRLPRRYTLAHGSHNTYGSGTCAMELVDYLDRRRRGERVARTDRLTDAPACTCPVIGAFVRAWNDGLRSDAERKRVLGDLLPLLLDTNTGRADSERRAWMALDWLVRVHAVAWLRLAGLTGCADALAALPDIDSSDRAGSAVEQIRAAGAAAEAAAGDAAWGAAWAAAWAAARDAAWGAAWAAAGDAARDAAGAAAGAAAGDAARGAARAAARAAAWDRLAPTTAELQESARELVRRMCAVGRP